jgi:hypothetical protein
MSVWYAFTRGHVVVIAKILADNAPPTITEVNALDTRLRSGSAGDSDHHLDHLPVSAGEYIIPPVKGLTYSSS